MPLKPPGTPAYRKFLRYFLWEFYRFLQFVRQLIWGFLRQCLREILLVWKFLLKFLRQLHMIPLRFFIGNFFGSLEISTKHFENSIDIYFESFLGNSFSKLLQRYPQMIVLKMKQILSVFFTGFVLASAMCKKNDLGNCISKFFRFFLGDYRFFFLKTAWAFLFFSFFVTALTRSWSDYVEIIVEISSANSLDILSGFFFFFFLFAWAFLSIIF